MEPIILLTLIPWKPAKVARANFEMSNDFLSKISTTPSLFKSDSKSNCYRSSRHLRTEPTVGSKYIWRIANIQASLRVKWTQKLNPRFSKFGSEYLTFIVFFKAIFKLKLDVWWYDFAPGRRGGERRFLLSGAQSIDTTDITIQNFLTLPWNFPDFSLIKKKCADQINIAANWSWISFLIKGKKNDTGPNSCFFSFHNGMR